MWSSHVFGGRWHYLPFQNVLNRPRIPCFQISADVAKGITWCTFAIGEVCAIQCWHITCNCQLALWLVLPSEDIKFNLRLLEISQSQCTKKATNLLIRIVILMNAKTSGILVWGQAHVHELGCFTARAHRLWIWSLLCSVPDYQKLQTGRL